MSNQRGPRPRPQRFESILETIGNTPLVRLNQVTAGILTPVYAKAEFFNPGGSLKDRIGLASIENAEQRGKLKAGGTIVEGTSGNTGVGLAVAAALKGYRCVFTMPDKMSDEKVRTVGLDAPLEHISTLLSSSTPAALVRHNGGYLGIVTRYDVLHKVAGIR